MRSSCCIRRMATPPSIWSDPPRFSRTGRFRSFAHAIAATLMRLAGGAAGAATAGGFATTGATTVGAGAGGTCCCALATVVSVVTVVRKPKAAGANRLMSIDLHASQIQGFFDGPVDHLIA